MTFLFTIIGSIIAYISLSIYSLYKKHQTIERVELAIEFMLDKRFKYIEAIISGFDNKNLYEETPLYEIAKLRSQAQKYKAENDKRAEYFCESKITSLVDILINHKKDFSVLDKMINFNTLIEQVLLAENQLEELITKYNKIIQRYNRSKSNWIGSLIIAFIPNLNRDIEDWPR